MPSRFDSIIISLSPAFAIPTNPGLHGDMQFFETSADHSMTVCAPFCEGDTQHYFYACHDSDEGMVTISYQTHSGEDAECAERSETWDVTISTGSDVWGLAETGTAVRDAIALHKALGRDKAHRE